MLSTKSQRIQEGKFAYKSSSTSESFNSDIGLWDTFSCNSVHNLTAGCIMEIAITVLYLMEGIKPPKDLNAPPTDDEREEWAYAMLRVSRPLGFALQRPPEQQLHVSVHMRGVPHTILPIIHCTQHFDTVLIQPAMNKASEIYALAYNEIPDDSDDDNLGGSSEEEPGTPPTKRTHKVGT